MKDSITELYDLLSTNKNELNSSQIELLVDDFIERANQKISINNEGKYIIEFDSVGDFNGVLICKPNKKTIQKFNTGCDVEKKIVVSIDDDNELYVVNANIESYVERFQETYDESDSFHKKSITTIVGNIIWVLLGGLLTSATWAISGVLWCITIIGIPIGKQCFKFAKLTLAPFGKEIVFTKSGAKTIVNIIWLLLTGLYYAVSFVIVGVFFYITIIGIPFGKQYMKFAKLSLMPFGAKIIKK